jgi:hypothetical protein
VPHEEWLRSVLPGRTRAATPCQAERVAIKPKATTLATAKPAGAAKGSVYDEAAAKGKTTATPTTPTVDAPQRGLGDMASLISSGLRQRDGWSAAADPGYQHSVSARAGRFDVTGDGIAAC